MLSRAGSSVSAVCYNTVATYLSGTLELLVLAVEVSTLWCNASISSHLGALHPIVKLLGILTCHMFLCCAEMDLCDAALRLNSSSSSKVCKSPLRHRSYVYMYRDSYSSCNCGSRISD